MWKFLILALPGQMTITGKFHGFPIGRVSSRAGLNQSGERGQSQGVFLSRDQATLINGERLRIEGEGCGMERTNEPGNHRNAAAVVVLLMSEKRAALFRYCVAAVEKGGQRNWLLAGNLEGASP